MTAVERRFLAGFREADTNSPGLIQEDDGTIWLVAPNGTRTQLPGGGGSAVQVGSGSPVGSVIPSGIGAQYLDSDTDTLYVATGVTSADWAATSGGSLPDPVTQQVTIAPTGAGNGPLVLNPADPQLYGLLIEALAGFRDDFSAYLRIIDEDGQSVLNVDDGGMDMTAANGENRHMLFSEDGSNNQASLSNLGLGIFSQVVGRVLNASASVGLQLGAFTPSDAPQVNSVQVFYDGTPGSAKVKFRAKDDNGDTVVAEIALT